MRARMEGSNSNSKPLNAQTPRERWSTSPRHSRYCQGPGRPGWCTSGLSSWHRHIQGSLWKFAQVESKASNHPQETSWLILPTADDVKVWGAAVWSHIPLTRVHISIRRFCLRYEPRPFEYCDGLGFNMSSRQVRIDHSGVEQALDITGSSCVATHQSQVYLALRSIHRTRRHHRAPHLFRALALASLSSLVPSCSGILSGMAGPGWAL